MPPRDLDTDFPIKWDNGEPRLHEWLAWLEAITPLICMMSGRLP